MVFGTEEEEKARRGVSKVTAIRPAIISEKYIATVCRRLMEDRLIRRVLPEWGRLHIDRQLPFICVYRRPADGRDAGTERLIMGEASYMTATGKRKHYGGLSDLLTNIANTLAESFGTFLILEVWTADAVPREDTPPSYRPFFRIVRPKREGILATEEALQRELGRITIEGEAADVKVVSSSKVAPPGMRPLVPLGGLPGFPVHTIGVEIKPVFRDTLTGQVLPIIRRTMHRKMSRAFRRSFFAFIRNETTRRPPHYHALGRRSMVKAVWEVDNRLAEISNGFDFLLQVTPSNTERAWASFRKSRYERVPDFTYRPLPVDPALVKRQLFRVPIERIEDPTIGHIFRQQQVDLDRKLTMLSDRGTSLFKYGSIQLYGGVESSLLALADDILRRYPPRSREESASGTVDPATFARRAMEEIEYFRRAYPEVKSRVEIRDDLSGLMVSRGNLLIGSRTKIPRSRVEALVQHEVGTHILTYYNGRAQPFRQLYVGLSGYEDLQEGLAVLAEYLVGGLTRPRLRLIAARVVAAHRMIDGGTFVDLFRELSGTYRIDRRSSFMITMRVFRGGGLTKDTAYLRGLAGLLEYLKRGGAFDTLLVGKINADHVPVIRELQWRKVLKPAPLTPSYLDDPECAGRLQRIAEGISVQELMERRNT